MVTAGLLPEGDRPAIAEMLMRDNPALWIASGAVIGLTEKERRVSCQARRLNICREHCWRR